MEGKVVQGNHGRIRKKNHSADTYRLYNPEKKSIIENRDVSWLDWHRLNPARNLSIFVNVPELLTNLGIEDEEMPVTTR
jgi:hypothetical protein